MNQRGFTLIELMIVLAIVGIVYAIVSTGVSMGSASDMSYGINGLTEVRCIDGLKFVVGQSGSVQQMLGPNGGGIQCQ